MSRSRKKKREFLPATSAGLLSFAGEEAGGVKVPPYVPLIMTLVVVLAEIILWVFM
ncbi:MAG: preprotein translocase subunit Sec61beta [Thermoproteota archaeon]|nr:MAG: preprotein translocase subunit Sec61beta [Candidatus Korarchaeota archaeon]